MDSICVHCACPSPSKFMVIHIVPSAHTAINRPRLSSKTLFTPRGFILISSVVLLIKDCSILQSVLVSK